MIEAILKGLGFGLLLTIAVGPVLFSIIKQSLNNGHKGDFLLSSVYPPVILPWCWSVIYLQNCLTRSKSTGCEIGIAGCVFLITMGVYFLFFKKVKVNEEGRALIIKFRKRDYAKIFLSGYFMNTLNPGIFIFWITTSTAVITHSVNQRIIIFVTCLLFVLLSDVLKVLLAGKIRNRLTPHNIHIINRINGIILIGFGIALIAGLLFYPAQ